MNRAASLSTEGATIYQPRPKDRAVGRSDGPGSTGAWDRALQAGAIGAALGVLLVSAPMVTWTARTEEALLLIPSIVAGVWGSAHLARLAREIPASLVGKRLHARAGSQPLRVVGGSVLRVAGTCLTLSVLACVAFPADARAGVLAGFGLLALVTMLASLLESFGRSGRTIAAVVAGVAVEHLATGRFAGEALVVGGGVAAAALLLMVAAQLRRPATLLATTLWIT